MSDAGLGGAAPGAGARFYQASGIKSAGRKNRRKKSDMEALRKAIHEILEADHPQTVRQVFYAMTVRGLVGKSEAEYDGTVCRLIGELREADDLPWGRIVDNTRWRRRPVTFTGLSDAIWSLAKGYRRDLWADARDYIEIWVEKDALAGVLIEETDPLDVPLMVAKGYTSKSFAFDAAKNLEAVGVDKNVFVYHLGDSDPSGEDAARDVEAKLRRYAPDTEIHFKRIAVLDEQIERWDLPLRPNKPGDTQTKKFHRQAGSVELDAIPARELRKLVRDVIMQHVDEDLHARLKTPQDGERKYLMRWPPVFRQGHGWGVAGGRVMGAHKNNFAQRGIIAGLSLTYYWK
jgi:hypothetical protein